MSRYWNSRVQSLTPYVPGEQPRDRKFIKLNTNENPYPPSPAVIRAIKDAAGEGLRLYPDPGCGELRRAIAERYGVNPEQVFVGNGSDEVLAFVFAALFSPAPKDGADPGVPAPLPILFPDITYSFYPVYAKLWDLPFRTLPLGDDFSIDIEAYRKPCGGVIFPNPNAPTGLALSLEETLSLAEYQEKQGRVVVVDEAYAAFGEGLSLVPHIGAHPNLLTVHTFSKWSALAGLRAGYAIGNGDLIEGLNRVRDSFNSYTLDRLAQAGAAAAIRDIPYYAGTRRRIIATRERVAGALLNLGYRVIPSSANFLFIRSPVKGGTELFAALRERGILARHFNQGRIADFLRVSIGTDEEMDLFLEALRGIEGSKGGG
ncbi:MAG: aminotransferase class I/II-fold pyridoxal phosphate-dependent enzyme [Treponema sp.]|jgi:histidinol-phosphate aminotransferase|nr:aminotransferase class I/II-fold pyridoxal phosphate-dependent enzyme [Treponema sp.]